MTREITIKPVLNGWLCVVGCQSVVFNSKIELLGELGKYFDAPEETEKRYLRDAVNRLEGPQAQAECARTPETTSPMAIGTVSSSPVNQRSEAAEPRQARR